MLFKILLISILALGTTTAHPAVTEPEPDPYAAMGGIGSNISIEDKAKLMEMSKTMIDSSLNALKSPRAEEVTQYGPQMQRRADDIADVAMSNERKAALEFLGIPPDSSTSLYIFVSHSMPLDMIRAYALEAMWSGGTLVFKGVQPGKSLKDFITEDMGALVYGKGANAAIALDPRLFDTYGITVVPTIVVTTERKNFECVGINPVSFEYSKKALSYDTCPPLDPSKYWKMSGAVTVDFALRAFIEKGAEGAKANLAALAQGLRTGERAPKEQRVFAGNWKDAISPEELMATKKAIEAIRLSESPPKPQ